jgi:predicted alpha/beta-hydrolase family hydrolase
MDDGDILAYANGRLMERNASFTLDDWRYYLDYLRQRRHQGKKPPPKAPTPPDKSAA